MLRTVFFLLVFLVYSENSHAHFVWLERDGDGPARAYFGEWIDDIREKSGELLNRFTAPRVLLGASTEPLPVKCTYSSFFSSASFARLMIFPPICAVSLGISHRRESSESSFAIFASFSNSPVEISTS
jgi:hypothetical protein